jgi:hypothetical protein
MNTQLIDSLINIINSLPEEEQLIFYQKLPPYQGKNKENSEIDWENEPFIGMWKDREDMKNSQQWVRQLRQQEWS